MFRKEKKINKLFEHQKGIITESDFTGYKLHTGLHIYKNAYNFYNKPVVGSIGVAKNIFEKTNTVIWSSERKKASDSRLSIENSSSSTNYPSFDDLSLGSVFGNPIYYDFSSVHSGNNVLCPSYIDLPNLISQKAIPVYMIVEKLQTTGSSVFVYVGWNEYKSISGNNFIFYYHWLAAGHIALPNPYFNCIPTSWSVYWGHCVYPCENCGNLPPFSRHGYLVGASIKQTIKAVKNGVLKLRFIVTSGAVEHDCNNTLYYKSCNPYACEGGAAYVSYKIRIYYQKNHPLWDSV